MANTKPAKKKKISHQTGIKELIKHHAKQAAKDVQIIRKIDVERKVARLVVRGKSIESSAAHLGISTNEAHKMLKDVVTRWLSEEAMTSVELREIMVRQLDSVLALAMHETFPHPLTDAQGQPVMVKVCDCDTDNGKCDEPDHMIQGTSQPNIQWAGMIESILDRKAKLIGLDAAHKLEEQKADLLKRIYVGVDAKTIDAL